MREHLSLVVTTLNNAATLERCLASADWADDVVVLDSGSSDAVFEHYGEPDIATKVGKINAYSSGLVEHKRRKRQRFVFARLVLYPWFFFLRQYFGKRWFLDGWAGFINAVSAAYYVFLKYAKVYEAQRNERQR